MIGSTAIDLFLNLLVKIANRSPGLGGFQLNSQMSRWIWPLCSPDTVTWAGYSARIYPFPFSSTAHMIMPLTFSWKPPYLHTLKEKQYNRKVQISLPSWRHHLPLFIPSWCGVLPHDQEIQVRQCRGTLSSDTISSHDVSRGTWNHFALVSLEILILFQPLANTSSRWAWCFSDVYWTNVM